MADGVWEVPCTTYLEVAFNFGGVTIPIHPLDTVTDDFKKVDTSGKPICIGAVSTPTLVSSYSNACKQFQPITSAFSLLGTFDIIL